MTFLILLTFWKREKSTIAIFNINLTLPYGKYDTCKFTCEYLIDPTFFSDLFVINE